jgi:hypothetical protein
VVNGCCPEKKTSRYAELAKNGNTGRLIAAILSRHRSGQKASLLRLLRSMRPPKYPQGAAESYYSQFPFFQVTNERVSWVILDRLDL